MSQIPSESYTFRVSVLQPVTTVALAPDGLVVQREGGAARTVAYSRISQVRLSYEPTRVQSDLYFCRLWARGESVPFAVISSTRYRGVMNFEPQLAAYRALVEGLHQQLNAGNTDVVHRAGVTALAYWGNALFLTLAVAFASALFFAMAGDVTLQTRHWVRLSLVAVLVPLAFAWFWANRPRPYDPRAIPPELLPNG